MPKASSRPEYTNAQAKELIMDYIHDKTDRKMLYWRLVDGDTIAEIAAKTGLDYKTVWNHIHEGEKEIFSHLPGS